jgi:2,4-dienoyl-CoA reductase-like NADH-dependent reductase (Old Yellow Enzyme family)
MRESEQSKADLPPRSEGAEHFRSQLAGSSALAPLFTPLVIGTLRVPNRFVMAPMTRSFSPGGVPPTETAAYYRRRAAGEAGLIITEGVGIPHESAIGLSGVDVPDIPNLFGDAALASWKRVVEEVHGAGGLIAPQLWHQGVMRVPGSGTWPKARSMRPSGVWGPLDRSSLVKADYIDSVAALTTPMTENEIADVIHAYVRAALNAQDLGFDAIAIHGAHGYLIDTFLWHETNLRTDGWGGDRAGRSAFPAAVVQAIRRAVGPSLPISFRFSQWKLQDASARLANTPQELEALLGPIAAAGVDLFEVSERNFDTPAFEGSTVSLAGWTKKVTGRLTMTVGNVGLSKGLFEARGTVAAEFLDNLGQVLRRFENDEFDLVAVGRMMIANPDWVRRLRLGLPLRVFDRSLLQTLL